MKIDEVKGDLSTQKTSSSSISASDATRTAANAAVKQALIRDATLMMERLCHPIFG